jgi:hypothetical protein
MHVQQEAWFGDAGDDRDDPTLIWTGSRARVELHETAPPPPPSSAPLVLWSVIPALAALFGAAIIMRVLVMADPVPQSSPAPALATEHAPAPAPPLRLPAPAPAIVDESGREEVEPARRPVAHAHSRRAHAKKAIDASAPGTLRINSLPWAEVYLDGTHVGSTPQSKLSMKPGRHRVKLVNEQMALRKTFDVYIRPGEVVTRSENLSL